MDAPKDINNNIDDANEKYRTAAVGAALCPERCLLPLGDKAAGVGGSALFEFPQRPHAHTGGASGEEQRAEGGMAAALSSVQPGGVAFT